MEPEEKQIRDAIAEKVKEYYRLKFAHQNFYPGKSRVNYAGRVFSESELLNLVDSSLDFWLTAGRYAEEFSARLEEFYGISNAILVNSGSSANLLAISALTSYKLGEKRLKPGDEVITVAAGFPTTIAPIVQNRLVPVFVDVEIGTYNAVTEEVKKAISEKTRAICMAHTLGNAFDLDAITEIVEENDLWLVEDNCDAMGTRYNHKLTGTFGHLATGSFYPAHHITTGEGGVVLTDDDQLARIVKSFRDWGRDCYCEGGENDTCGRRFSQSFGNLPYGYDHKYVYSHIGYNLKMTDMQAAVGSAQIERIEYFTQRRKDNFARIYRGLDDLQQFIILPEATAHSDPSWFSFIISVKDGVSRNELVRFLSNKQIETRNLFAGNLLRHPAFMKIPQRVISELKNTDYIMNNTFFVGCYPGMTDQKIDYMIDMFHNFFQQK